MSKKTQSQFNTHEGRNKVPSFASKLQRKVPPMTKKTQSQFNKCSRKCSEAKLIEKEILMTASLILTHRQLPKLSSETEKDKTQKWQEKEKRCLIFRLCVLYFCCYSVVCTQYTFFFFLNTECTCLCLVF